MQNPIELFKNCGKKPGIEIWVVRQVKPRRETFPCLFKSQPKDEPEYEAFSVPPRRHGVFYNQDLYVVVKTSSDLSQKDVHFWFGGSYAGTPPKWVNSFESLELNWKGTEHYEFQGLECPQFESYFTKGLPVIRYKRGSHPEPDAEKRRGETRFYKVEIRENALCRVREIPFNIALMTEEECFILDTDFNTRVYISNKTETYERNKSIIFTNNIREIDHEGDGEVEVVDQTTFTNKSHKEQFAKAAEYIQNMPDEVVNEIPPSELNEDTDNADLYSLLYLYGEDAYPPRFKYVPKIKKAVAEEKTISFKARVKKCITDGMRKVFGTEKEPVYEAELPKLEEKFSTNIEKKPITREMLNSKKYYLLQGKGASGVYLWVGKASDASGREDLIECLQNEILASEICKEKINDDFNVEEIMKNEVYIKNEDKDVEKGKDDKKEKDLTPRWTHILKITEGNETDKFKKFFKNWQ